MMRQPLPRFDQPANVLRNRFEQALIRTWVPHEVGTPPGRENVFDFEDGARLIVTRELHQYDGPVLIHISLSANVPRPIRVRPDPEKALRYYWALLTDRPFVPDDHGVIQSCAGYAHVFMEAK